MKEVIGYTEFCKEKGLNFSSQKSQTEYQKYTGEIDIENRSHYDDIYRKAEEIKSILSKKK
ncbi:hypothetical protein [Psychromonas aquimarina]|uniref:hypothetical protein n=1 Tax=Psychromonas aquimarina TaxID=444919 RepID=UPI000412CA52|nr:hypothetical protein [Psychromonas aquimarina]